MIAAITQAEVLRTIRRHLQRAADPPPLAPARARQATCDGVAAVASEATCVPRRGVSPLWACAIPFESIPSSLPSRPSRGRRPRAPLMALPYPILRWMSRLRGAALRRAAGRAGAGSPRPSATETTVPLASTPGTQGGPATLQGERRQGLLRAAQI